MTDRTPPPIRYTGGRLDRAGSLRQDEAWISAARADPRARVVPVWRDRSLVVGLPSSPAPPHGAAAGEPRAGWCVGERYAELAADDRVTWAFLGLDGDVPVFTADVSVLDDARAAGLAGDGAFMDLRAAGPLVSASDAALMAHARALVSWHRRARYCGTCGSATTSHHGGHMRRCGSAECGAELYPRTDPAVIMLVERAAADGRPRQCLLARHNRLPPRAFSTLAGFVEPGESLEEAVAREVMEETGVHVSRVTYHASQPWPFPASLMIAFRALADTDAITVDTNELEEARWFSAADLAAFGEWDDEHAEFRLPSRSSIARVLVEEWLNGRE